MFIQFTFVNQANEPDKFVNMPTVPREGEVVAFPNMPQYNTVVRTVVWYPDGDDDTPGPFVYVVLGPKRPTQ